MISPSHGPHAVLQDEVNDILSGRGFLVDSAAYHEKMSKAISDRLSQIDTPESHYYRTRADRIAVHKTMPCVFELEIKTGTGRHKNAAIEALPLLWHMVHAKYGIRCLYVYGSVNESFEIDSTVRGWWASVRTTPQFSVLVPPRRSHLQDSIRQLMQGVYHDIGDMPVVAPMPSTSGSGDPFALIRKEDVLRERSWTDIVDEHLDRYRCALDDAA